MSIILPNFLNLLLVQGFAHGVRRFISSFAMLIGPIFGSGTLPWLFVLFGIPLALSFLSLVSLFLIGLE